MCECVFVGCVRKWKVEIKEEEQELTEVETGGSGRQHQYTWCA